MKGRRQIDRNDGVPFVDRELIDRGNVLDARVVHEDVDRPEFLSACRQIIPAISSPFSMLAGE
jgi:hypothetical protein